MQVLHCKSVDVVYEEKILKHVNNVIQYLIVFYVKQLLLYPWLSMTKFCHDNMSFYGSSISR